MENNIKSNTYKMCIFGLFMAMICILTMFTKVPIPLGYAHLGDSIIMMFALCYGAKSGFLVCGIGSALSDLLSGYPEWIIPTLIIKGFMAVIISIIGRNKEGKYKVLSIKTLIASIVCMLFMTFGYVIVGIIMQGYAAGIASAPGLLMESFVNIIAFFIITPVVQKVIKVKI